MASLCVNNQDFFYVRRNARYEQVRFSELIYVKAMRGYVQVVTERQAYIVQVRIQDIQKQLPPEQFCRTHRSYIVAIKRIISFDNFVLELEPPPEGKVYQSVLARKTQLPLGKHYRVRLRQSVNLIKNRMGAKSKAFLEAKFKNEYDLAEE